MMTNNNKNKQNLGPYQPNIVNDSINDHFNHNLPFSGFQGKFIQFNFKGYKNPNKNQFLGRNDSNWNFNSSYKNKGPQSSKRLQENQNNDINNFNYSSLNYRSGGGFIVRNEYPRTPERGTSIRAYSPSSNIWSTSPHRMGSVIKPSSSYSPIRVNYSGEVNRRSLIKNQSQWRSAFKTQQSPLANNSNIIRSSYGKGQANSAYGNQNQPIRIVGRSGNKNQSDFRPRVGLQGLSSSRMTSNSLLNGFQSQVFKPADPQRLSSYSRQQQQPIHFRHNPKAENLKNFGYESQLGTNHSSPNFLSPNFRPKS